MLVFAYAAEAAMVVVSRDRASNRELFYRAKGHCHVLSARVARVARVLSNNEIRNRPRRGCKI
jgi:hypothetical protein